MYERLALLGNWKIRRVLLIGSVTLSKWLLSESHFYNLNNEGVHEISRFRMEILRPVLKGKEGTGR